MKLVFTFFVYMMLFTSLFYAEAETLEQRKERIMRKYFREQTIVYNSDLVIEETIEEDQIQDTRLSLAEDNKFLKHTDIRDEDLKKSSSFINKEMYEQWMRKKILQVVLPKVYKDI